MDSSRLSSAKKTLQTFGARNTSLPSVVPQPLHHMASINIELDNPLGVTFEEMKLEKIKRKRGMNHSTLI